MDKDPESHPGRKTKPSPQQGPHTKNTYCRHIFTTPQSPVKINLSIPGFKCGWFCVIIGNPVWTIKDKWCIDAVIPDLSPAFRYCTRKAWDGAIWEQLLNLLVIVIPATEMRFSICQFPDWWSLINTRYEYCCLLLYCNYSTELFICPYKNTHCNLPIFICVRPMRCCA